MNPLVRTNYFSERNGIQDPAVNGDQELQGLQWTLLPPLWPYFATKIILDSGKLCSKNLKTPRGPESRCRYDGSFKTSNRPKSAEDLEGAAHVERVRICGKKNFELYENPVWQFCGARAATLFSRRVPMRSVVTLYLGGPEMSMKNYIEYLVFLSCLSTLHRCEFWA